MTASDRIVLNAYFSGGHSPGGFRTWWRRWHSDGDQQLDNAHLMRLAGRFARRVRACAQAHGIPVIDCKAGERKHQIAEHYLAEHPPGRTGVFLILVARAPATVWKVDPIRGGRDLQPGEEQAVRQPLLVSHHRPDVGARDDQDQRPPAVRRAGDPQRPRVRRVCRALSGDRLQEGGQLLHSGRRPRAAGADRRHLLPTRGDRAPEPGDRSVDLQRVPVLRAQHRRAATERVRLRLLDLPGRVQPQLGVRLRCGDGSLVQHDGRPHPIPARRAEGAHAVRQQRPPASPPGQRALAPPSGRDRETSVESDDLQGPLRTADT